MKRRFWPFIVTGTLLGLTAVVLIRLQATQVKGSPSTALPALTSPSAGTPVDGKSVARFSYNRGKDPQRELSPTDPRYDPVALSKEDDLMPKEVFDREPRDDNFAPILEQRMQSGYWEALRELKLDSKVHAVSADCRTLSCYTYVEVAKDDGVYVFDRINALILGNRHSPGLLDVESSDSVRITFHTLLEPSMRDERVWDAFVIEGFSGLIRNMKMMYPLE